MGEWGIWNKVLPAWRPPLFTPGPLGPLGPLVSMHVCTYDNARMITLAGVGNLALTHSRTLFLVAYSVTCETNQSRLSFLLLRRS